MNALETETPNVKFSPLSIARAIWKRKFLVLGFWLVLTAAVIVIVARLPAVYQAEALILVDSQKIPDKFVSSTVNSDLQDRITTISQQILSSTGLKKVIDDFRLYPVERKTLFEEELLEKMRKDIGIKLEPGYNKNRPGAFRISFQGPDPASVAQVANRLANLFIEENLRTREVQAQGTSEFIDAQLQEAKKTLDEQEKAVTEYKLQHNGELPQQENSISSVLARLQVELATNRDAINRTQQNKVMVENSLSTTEASLSALSAAIAVRNSSPQNLAVFAGAGQGFVSVGKKPSEVRKAELEDLLKQFAPLHPQVRRMEREIARLEANEAIQESAAAVAAAAAAASNTSSKADSSAPFRAGNVTDALNMAQVNERISTLKAQLSLTDKDLEFRKAEHDRIVRDMTSSEARLSRLPIREQEMARITRDYEMSKVNYRSLLDKRLAAVMATDMEHRQKSERFNLLDAARTPGRPQKPNRELLDAAGALAGLAFGIFIAFALELRRDVILGEWELPSDVVILGRLPNILITGAAFSNPQAPATRTPKPSVYRRFAIVGSVLVAIFGVAAAAGWYVVNH
jgi:succinoglycan biosynthesis transport protein ExoP